MRVIITGGTGLIGRRLAELLANDGEDVEVVVLSRNPEKHRPPGGARAVRWDGRTPDGWGDLVDGDAAIVNLAGENLTAGGWSEERKRLMRSSRIQAAEAVARAVRGAKEEPAALVQASAASYYGGTSSVAATEASPPGRGFRPDMMRAVEDTVAALDVRKVVLRTGAVLAPEGGGLPVLLRAARLARRFGDGRQYVSWIHADDVVRAIRFLLADRSASGAYNLTAPKPVTNRELLNSLGRAAGRPGPFPVPAFLLRRAMGDQAEVMLTSERVVPQKLLDAGFEFRFPELGAALQDLLGDGARVPRSGG